MSKNIIDENGNKYVQKKPFYKKFWFWIVVVILVIIIGGSMGKSDKDTPVKSNDNSTSEKSKSSNDSKAKQTNFKLTDTVDLDGVKFKVNNVSYSEGDDIFKPDSGKQFVKVNITITNTGSDKFDYNSFDFKLNDKGNQTDLTEITTDSNNQLSSGILAKGGSVTGNMTGQAIKGDKLQLLYKGSIFEKDEKFSIDLN